MSAVDSGLDAVSFNPVNMGPLWASAVNSLWAWLAAAFSFWHLRSSPSSTNAHTTTCEATAPEAVQRRASSSTTPIAKTTSVSASEKKEEEGVLTMRRGNSMNKERLFKVYYYGGQKDEVEGGDEGMVKRWGGWRVEMRGTGDLGWYGFQDRRVIDGSVVRLWGKQGSCGRRVSVGVTPLVIKKTQGILSGLI